MPVGKAKVILDLRAGTGLSSRRVRLQHQDIQPFRCGVHGGRESRGSGADDDHVAYLGLVDGFVEAQAVGDLLIGRVPQHHLATADHHRHIRGGDLKLVQQNLNVGVTVEIDVRVRMAVARQELFDAKRSSAMIRPDDARHLRAPAQSTPPGEG